jgi:hypothetical protein
MIGLGLEGRRQTGASKLHTLYIKQDFSHGLKADRLPFLNRLPIEYVPADGGRS